MAIFIGVNPANSQRMADVSAQLMYQKNLGSATSAQADLDAAQLGSSYRLQESKAHTRIGQLLRSNSRAAMEKNLATCTPTDLLVYMESHCLPNHACTMLPDGSIIASPSGANGCQQWTAVTPVH